MSEQENIRIVQKAYDAFQQGNVQGVLDTLTDNIEWITPGPPDLMPVAGKRRGHHEVTEFFSTLNKQEDVEMFEPREYIAQGDKVVVLIKYRGRVKATGRTAEADLVHVFTLRDNRIERFEEYFDTASTLDAYRPAAQQASAGSAA